MEILINFNNCKIYNLYTISSFLTSLFLGPKSVMKGGHHVSTKIGSTLKEAH